MAAAVTAVAGLARADVIGPTTQQIAAEQLASDWPSYGNTYSEAHYSPLTSIDARNVSALRLAFHVDLDSGQRTDSQPIEYAGVLYVATGLSVVRAIDARTGATRWRYDPEVAAAAGDKLRPSWGIRGLALADGRVFVATQDGRLLALDSRDGSLLWSTATLDAHDETTITGAPRAFNGKVVIGFTGGDRDITRGGLNCFDAATGALLWRFNTVPPPPGTPGATSADVAAAKTWNGDWWLTSGGGAVWNAITYDAKYDQLYIGTGNAGPWNWKIRGGGDNLYTASIVALDAQTGQYRWHYQETPGDAWDYDSTADIALATLTFGKRRRDVILHAPKNGFFYVIERRTGRLMSAEKYEKVTWATRVDLNTGRPVENRVARYRRGPVEVWPSNMGAHNWSAMAYSRAAGLAFIPLIHAADVYGDAGIDVAHWTPQKHRWNFGINFFDAHGATAPLDIFSSSLLAWDPQRQQALWKTPTPGRAGGGVMATAAELVFQGHLDGTLTAYAARTGAALWSFQSDAAVLGAPISYQLDGKQYVAVLSGPPVAGMADSSTFVWQYRDPRRLLVFTLGGADALPTASPRSALPGRETRDATDPTTLAQGKTLYETHCIVCHGADARSGGGAPDLRTSSIPGDLTAFATIVGQGALMLRGMPRFDELNPVEVEAIRLYVRAQNLGTSAK